jgi:hypothetical protein
VNRVDRWKAEIYHFNPCLAKVPCDTGLIATGQSPLGNFIPTTAFRAPSGVGSMRVIRTLALAVAFIVCVTTGVFAQGTNNAQPSEQFVAPPVITYGTPTVVQSTPIIANSPVVAASKTQTAGENQAPTVTYSPGTPDATAPVTQSAPVVTYYPVVPSAAPITTYRAVVPRGAVVNYRPFIPATQVDLSPRPVVTYRPVISGVAPAAAYRPVIAAPVVTYRPVLPSYASPIVGPTAAYYPTTAAYYPTTAAYYPATAAYRVGPTVTVRPKVYVSGQPIRNVLRAITP